MAETDGTSKEQQEEEPEAPYYNPRLEPWTGWPGGAVSAWGRGSLKGSARTAQL